MGIANQRHLSLSVGQGRCSSGARSLPVRVHDVDVGTPSGGVSQAPVYITSRSAQWLSAPAVGPVPDGPRWPYLMAAPRFLIAGTLLFVVLRLRGVASPKPREWLAAGAIGTLLLVKVRELLGLAFGFAGCATSISTPKSRSRRSTSSVTPRVANTLQPAVDRQCYLRCKTSLVVSRNACRAGERWARLG